MNAMEFAQLARRECTECGSPRLHWEWFTEAWLSDWSVWSVEVSENFMEAWKAALAYTGGEDVTKLYGAPCWVCLDCSEVGIFGP